MQEVTNYMNNNKLALNQTKTQIMIISKNQQTQEKFKINLENKEISHSKNVVILGNTLRDDLGWDLHITKELIPALNNRLRTLRMLSRYLPPKFRTNYSNSIFKSKLLYGMESWGGTSKKMISKIQKIQDQVTRITVQKKYKELNANQRQRILGWLSIKN